MTVCADRSSWTWLHGTWIMVLDISVCTWIMVLDISGVHGARTYCTVRIVLSLARTSHYRHTHRYRTGGAWRYRTGHRHRDRRRELKIYTVCTVRREIKSSTLQLTCHSMYFKHEGRRRLRLQGRLPSNQTYWYGSPATSTSRPPTTLPAAHCVGGRKRRGCGEPAGAWAPQSANACVPLACPQLDSCAQLSPQWNSRWTCRPRRSRSSHGAA